MRNLGSDTTGSRQGEFVAAAHSVLRNSLILAVVALWGCGQGPFEPAPKQPGPPGTVPFTVELRINEQDQIGDGCLVEVVAETFGGRAGSRAEWGHLEGSSYDLRTNEFLGISRTQQLHPEVFGSAGIGLNERQRGTVNLDRFRVDLGVPVLVRLKLYYQVWQDAASEGEERFAELTHRCM